MPNCLSSIEKDLIELRKSVCLVVLLARNSLPVVENSNRRIFVLDKTKDRVETKKTSARTRFLRKRSTPSRVSLRFVVKGKNWFCSTIEWKRIVARSRINSKKTIYFFDEMSPKNTRRSTSSLKKVATKRKFLRGKIEPSEKNFSTPNNPTVFCFQRFSTSRGRSSRWNHEKLDRNENEKFSRFVARRFETKVRRRAFIFVRGKLIVRFALDFSASSTRTKRKKNFPERTETWRTTIFSSCPRICRADLRQRSMTLIRRSNRFCFLFNRRVVRFSTFELVRCNDNRRPSSVDRNRTKSEIHRDRTSRATENSSKSRTSLRKCSARETNNSFSASSRRRTLVCPTRLETNVFFSSLTVNRVQSQIKVAAETSFCSSRRRATSFQRNKSDEMKRNFSREKIFFFFSRGKRTKILREKHSFDPSRLSSLSEQRTK